MDRRVLRSRARAEAINGALLRAEQEFGTPRRGQCALPATVAAHGGGAPVPEKDAGVPTEASLSRYSGRPASRLTPQVALAGGGTKLRAPRAPFPPAGGSGSGMSRGVRQHSTREAPATPGETNRVGRRAHMAAGMEAMQIMLERGEARQRKAEEHARLRAEQEEEKKRVAAASRVLEPFRLPVIRVPPASTAFAPTKPCSMHHILSQRGDLLARALEKAGFTIEWEAGRPADNTKHPVAAHVGPELADEFLDFIDGEQNMPARDEPNLAVSALNVIDAFVTRVVSGYRSRWRRGQARRRVFLEEQRLARVHGNGGGMPAPAGRGSLRGQHLRAALSAYGDPSSHADEGKLDGEGMLPADHGTEFLW